MKTDNETERVNVLINKCIRDENWEELIEVANNDLGNGKDDHWLLVMIGSAYYEKKDYDRAYAYIAQAMVLQQDCPLVLWHLASIFRMQDRQEEAISIWEELINKGENKVANDQCGEGIKEARKLLNDSGYMIGKTYLEMKEDELAKPFIKNYHKNIEKGMESIYDPDSLKIG